ncbi:hypothetical protein N6L24_04740 [Cognatishimia sp. SS12]|uniref:hypothetical protein n=1 Tax=Cognatishimia sp. SS12 TaxID=2979465 RepID=UPI00232F71C3|nr:hypothetical protein [Cognatishimia sp. SS12]MDC0737574.1 hypothetical protein [Cognatishimia sp. SS12]
MSAYSISKTRLLEGMWEGIVTAETADADQPILEVTHQDKPLEKIGLTERGEGHWNLRIPIPATLIADGVHTILIRDQQAQQTLDTITIVAGEPLAEDIRAEMDLLRAELDMLKRAFRRHCLETS